MISGCVTLLLVVQEVELSSLPSSCDAGQINRDQGAGQTYLVSSSKNRCVPSVTVHSKPLRSHLTCSDDKFMHMIGKSNFQPTYAVRLPLHPFTLDLMSSTCLTCKVSISPLSENFLSHLNSHALALEKFKGGGGLWGCLGALGSSGRGRLGGMITCPPRCVITYHTTR